MDDIFITNLYIESVRHLKDINIPLSNEKKKHLIITGQNGSGKTSLLEALSIYLDSVATDDNFDKYPDLIKQNEKLLQQAIKNNDLSKINTRKKNIEHFDKKIKETTKGLNVSFSTDVLNIYQNFNKGNFIIAFYSDNRIFQADISNHVEKIQLKETYKIKDHPRKDFVKYLVDLKVTEALYRNSKKNDKADEIERWFISFEELLKTIFDNDSLTLNFNEETFAFTINVNGREEFSFNELSSGYGAVLDIIVDLMLRMELQSNRSFNYNMPGIVLIDEIETHLHLELQKHILKMLTTVFPNIQFVVSTHSPFVLNSIDNVIIYDLENKTLVDEDVGLSNVPYSGIVEGYFSVESLSKNLKDKFEEYKKLVKKQKLEDNDLEEIARLEMYLDEIPDYLALDIATEYKHLKLEFEGKKDIN